MTSLRAGQSGVWIPVGGKRFINSPKRADRFCTPPVSWALRGKRHGRQAGQSSAFNFIKKDWSHTFITQYAFMECAGTSWPCYNSGMSWSFRRIKRARVAEPWHRLRTFWLNSIQFHILNHEFFFGTCDSIFLRVLSGAFRIIAKSANKLSHCPSVRPHV